VALDLSTEISICPDDFIRTRASLGRRIGLYRYWSFYNMRWIETGVDQLRPYVW